jgi:hypothetical protein
MISLWRSLVQAQQHQQLVMLLLWPVQAPAAMHKQGLCKHKPVLLQQTSDHHHSRLQLAVLNWQ